VELFVRSILFNILLNSLSANVLLVIYIALVWTTLSASDLSVLYSLYSSTYCINLSHSRVGWIVPFFVQLNVMLFAITNSVDLLD